jgi:hypothetical protein
MKTIIYRQFKILWVLYITVLFITGCAHFHAQPPSGFAVYKTSENNIYKAVSPDGVLYKVQSITHKPKAALAYWKEAIQKRMVDAGYVVIDTSSFELDYRDSNTGGHTAAILELAAPLGMEDHSYLIAIVPYGKRLLIVESSGEVNKFQKRKQDIITAIKAIRQ